MSTIDIGQLLRPGLLRGVSIAVAVACPGADAPPGARAGAAAPAQDSLGAAVAAGCARLGAHVAEIQLLGEQPPGAQEAAVERVLADVGSIALLAVDGASVFARAGAAGVAAAEVADDAEAVAAGGGREALGACLDASWNVTRAVVGRAFLPGGHGGRIVYLAPARELGAHADAARAGLENLARTLSIEWARHAITSVTIVPGASGDCAGASARASIASEVAALTAYLASAAGAYFSGCLLDLSGPAGGGG